MLCVRERDCDSSELNSESESAPLPSTTAPLSVSDLNDVPVLMPAAALTLSQSKCQISSPAMHMSSPSPNTTLHLQQEAHVG